MPGSMLGAAGKPRKIPNGTLAAVIGNLTHHFFSLFFLSLSFFFSLSPSLFLNSPLVPPQPSRASRRCQVEKRAGRASGREGQAKEQETSQPCPVRSRTRDEALEKAKSLTGNKLTATAPRPITPGFWKQPMHHLRCLAPCSPESAGVGAYQDFPGRVSGRVPST